MLNNIYIFHGLAARNEVGKTMVNISKIEGLGRFAEHVGGAGGSDDYVFYVWEDGQKQYFATDPDVYDALMGAMQISPEALNGIMKTAAAVTDVFRATVTRYSIPFVLRNLMKDAQEVAVNSELRNAWALPFMHTVKGLITQLDPKLRDVLNEAIDEGVMYSAITQIRANSLKGAAKEIRRAFRDGRLSEKSMDAVYKIVEYLGSLNEAIEVAPKITEYIALRQNGVPKKEAAMRARQVNIDFARGGSDLQRLNRYVAFLNANIQGLDKNLRTVSQRPMESIFKISLFEILPAILFWGLAMLHGDDDERKEYEEIPRTMKDLFYYVKVGDTWMKLPKPHGYNLFPALAERMLDAAYKKDPGAFRGLEKTFANELMPPLAPQFIKAPIEAVTNYGFFTGRPVVSDKYADLPPEMRYGPYTSSTAKALGGITGQSPMIIDHLIRGFTGSVGSALAHAPDALETGNTREARRVSEWPGIRAFTHTPYHSSESIGRFYDLARQTDYALTRYRASGGAMGISKDVSFAGLFAGTGRQLAGMRRARAEIQQHPGLPRKEKRERMDQIDKQMAELARQVLKVYDEN
jgi:hypothetical protein